MVSYDAEKIPIRKVCIVGAGPSGVAASKYVFIHLTRSSGSIHDSHLTDQMAYRYFLAENCFQTIDIFEQQASFGGVWNYSKDPVGKIDIPQTNPHQPLDEPVCQSPSNQNGIARDAQQVAFVSPMYEHLETNIPHNLMKFSDSPLLEDHQLYLSRENVIQYLEDYGEDVRYLVSFQTQVTSIHQTRPGAYHVRFKNLQDGSVYEKSYDAVVVASGHYTVPSIPNIKGIKEWDQVNPGVISHTKFYRRPEPFTDKKVLVVGNSASGTDIASQVGEVSKHPLLMSQRSQNLMAFTAGYKEIVPEIAEFLPKSQGRRGVRFVDGRVEEDFDAILFATGYYYSFPFLSSLEPKFISTGERVQHLYKQMFYIDDPTIAFLGLPSKIIPFRTVEAQAAVIARVWAGRLELPLKLEMRKWEETMIAERGTGKAFNVLLFPKDFEYYDELVDWAARATGRGGKLPMRWSVKETWERERLPAIKRAFADKGRARHDIKTLQELGFDYDAWLKEQLSQNGAESGTS